MKFKKIVFVFITIINLLIFLLMVSGCSDAIKEKLYLANSYDIALIKEPDGTMIEEKNVIVEMYETYILIVNEDGVEYRTSWINVLLIDNEMR